MYEICNTFPIPLYNILITFIKYNIILLIKQSVLKIVLKVNKYLNKYPFFKNRLKFCEYHFRSFWGKLHHSLIHFMHLIGKTTVKKISNSSLSMSLWKHISTLVKFLFFQMSQKIIKIVKI